MALSIQAQFRDAARANNQTIEAAMNEARKLYISAVTATKRRITVKPTRTDGWVPAIGDTAMVVRPHDAMYPDGFHAMTVEVRSLPDDENAMCRIKRGDNWSRLTAIPLADLYPSDKPPIDPRPVKTREDAWAGKRVVVSGCDSRHYGRRGIVVRGSRGKCVVRLNRGGEYEIAKSDLKIVG